MKKKICPIHGFWNQTHAKQRCPKCTKDRNKTYDRTRRNKELDKFYHSKQWKNTRALVLSENPFCVECGHPAQMVDHKKAIKDGGAKLDLDNLQSMCNSCHNKKEIEEGNRW